jgi:hypothetical protein
MTPDKQKQKLAGQTAIAQKVFQAVPIAEAWAVAQISQALHRTTGARLDRHTLQGCLRALADSDLIRSTEHGSLHQRVAVSAAQSTPPKTKESTVTQPAKPAVTQQSAPASAIDVVGAATKKIRAIADELDAWALAHEEEKSRTTGEVDKLKQLKALLKEIT